MALIGYMNIRKAE